jgi:hypothetical protein
MDRKIVSESDSEINKKHNTLSTGCQSTISQYFGKMGEVEGCLANDLGG